MEGSKGSKPCARHQLSSLLPVETVVHSPHGTDTLMHVLFCVDGTDPRGDHRREGKEAQQTQTLLKAHIEVFDTRIMLHTTARVVVDDLMLASNVRCSKYIIGVELYCFPAP